MVTGQKRDTLYVEALLTKRIEFVKKLKCDLSANSCATAQTVAAYSDLIEGDLIMPASTFPELQWILALFKANYISADCFGLLDAEILTDIAVQTHRSIRTGTVRENFHNYQCVPSVFGGWHQHILVTF